ncbi:MAG: hypothetical protein V4675_01200 [Verrucomicrobiota bacterium]
MSELLKPGRQHFLEQADLNQLKELDTRNVSFLIPFLEHDGLHFAVGSGQFRLDGADAKNWATIVIQKNGSAGPANGEETWFLPARLAELFSRPEELPPSIHARFAPLSWPALVVCTKSAHGAFHLAGSEPLEVTELDRSRYETAREELLRLEAAEHSKLHRFTRSRASSPLSGGPAPGQSPCC